MNDNEERGLDEAQAQAELDEAREACLPMRKGVLITGPAEICAKITECEALGIELIKAHAYFQVGAIRRPGMKYMIVLMDIGNLFDRLSSEAQLDEPTPVQVSFYRCPEGVAVELLPCRAAIYEVEDEVRQ